MTKYLIAAIVALTVALAGALWGVKALRDDNAAMVVSLNSEIEARAAAEAKTDRIQVQVQAEKARADANRSLLRNALKNNAEWAARPVPADVADSLCRKPAVCAQPAGTVR